MSLEFYTHLTVQQLPEKTEVFFRVICVEFVIFPRTTYVFKCSNENASTMHKTVECQ